MSFRWWLCWSCSEKSNPFSIRMTHSSVLRYSHSEMIMCSFPCSRCATAFVRSIWTDRNACHISLRSKTVSKDLNYLCHTCKWIFDWCFPIFVTELKTETESEWTSKKQSPKLNVHNFTKVDKGESSKSSKKSCLQYMLVSKSIYSWKAPHCCPTYLWQTRSV